MGEVVSGLRMDVAMRAIVDAFIDAIALLELSPPDSRPAQHAGMRYFAHAQGREGTVVTHEFFPYDMPVSEVIAIAHSISRDSPHLISPLGDEGHLAAAAYAAAGYVRSGAWTMMARPLATSLAQPGDERVRDVGDVEMEARVLRAVLPDGGTGHPLRGGFSGDARVRQQWVEDEGAPAAFGRIVLLGEFAYLGDVATAPPYRRRGHAAAITRRLLDDALTAGATTCLLATTAMAHGLYRSFDFADLMPIVEFQSPGVARA
jgi:GNAT superfamily N-acetyltransferase